MLGVPNTSVNRYQLKRAYKDEKGPNGGRWKGRKDEAEIEGAEVEKVTQHRSDFHQEENILTRKTSYKTKTFLNQKRERKNLKNRKSLSKWI